MHPAKLMRRGDPVREKKSDGDPQNEIRLPTLRRYLANHWLDRQVAELCQDCSTPRKAYLVRPA
jgi:hypothetical protein